MPNGSWRGRALVIFFATAALASIIFSVVRWEWLLENERRSEVLRNVGLFVAAAVSGLLVSWRNSVLERQADTAQQQAELGRRGTLDDRYQKSTEMLASDLTMVRVGGIRALENLALENPKDYLRQVAQILCAFVRHPTDSQGPHGEVREDVLIAAQAAWSCVEPYAQYRVPFGEEQTADLVARVVLEFSGATLRGVDLSEMRIVRLEARHADLRRAVLRYATLEHADLEGARLNGADLTRTVLRGANLRGATLTASQLDGAHLDGANLTGIWFEPFIDWESPTAEEELRSVGLEPGDPFVRGLTQNQLDLAKADPEQPPKLNGVTDARTGQQLEWRGDPPDPPFLDDGGWPPLLGEGDRQRGGHAVGVEGERA